MFINFINYYLIFVLYFRIPSNETFSASVFAYLFFSLIALSNLVSIMLNALELELELELVPKTDPKLERLLKSFSDDLLVELVKLLKLVELNEFVLLELFIP